MDLSLSNLEKIVAFNTKIQLNVTDVELQTMQIKGS